MKLSDSTYDVLKWVVMLALPAVATLVGSLGVIWGLPHADSIQNTIVAVNAALAMMLGISTVNYQKEKQQ